MEKPIILQIKEMKEGIFQEVNQYVNKIPATIILDTINEVRRQLMAEEQKQYENALREYKESEVKSNERFEDNKSSDSE